MKNIKKFLLIIAMTMALGTSAFAASGFEFILNVPFGLSVGFESIDMGMLPSGEGGLTQRKIEDAKAGIGFDIGVAAQLGYMFQVKDGFGISVLGELGYSHDTISGTFSKIEGGDGISFSGIKAIYTLEQFQIGLLPKFNIGAFSIGIGGGVKVPLGGKITYKAGDLKESMKIAMGDALTIFTPPVVGYVKATFDYSIFFTDNLALNVGLYLGGDIAKSELVIDENGNPGNISSFDIGVELGLKFGPRA